MRLLTTSVILLFALLVAACRYEPQDYAENRPEVDDAVRDLDIYAYGEGLIDYFETVGSGDDAELVYDCSINVDVVGWSDEEIDDSACIQCTEVITLGFARTDDSTCSFGIESSPSVGISSIDNLDPESWFYEWLQTNEPEGADGTAVAYLQSNWNPAGYADWAPRMGLYEVADPVGLDFVREYLAIYPYAPYHPDRGSGSWSVELRLTR